MRDVTYFSQFLNKTPPCPCALQVGDKVTFTNEYGVSFAGLRVIGFAGQQDDSSITDRFIYLDSSAYWYPHKLNELQKEKQ